MIGASRRYCLALVGSFIGKLLLTPIVRVSVNLNSPGVQSDVLGQIASFRPLVQP